MVSRRRVLGAVAAGGVVSVAGCSLLDDALNDEAQPAIVGEAALDETGYSHDRTDEQTLSETVEVGDQTQDVELTSWLVEYAYGGAIDVDLPNPVRYLLFSTPTVSVAGRDVNPLGQVDEEELLSKMSSRMEFEGLEGIEAVGERTVETLGNEVEITEFEAETEDSDVDVRLHLGSLTNEGDLIVFLGAHPEAVDEADNVDTLTGGIEHPVDPDDI